MTISNAYASPLTPAERMAYWRAHKPSFLSAITQSVIQGREKEERLRSSRTSIDELNDSDAGDGRRSYILEALTEELTAQGWEVFWLRTGGVQTPIYFNDGLTLTFHQVERSENPQSAARPHPGSALHRDILKACNCDGLPQPLFAQKSDGLLGLKQAAAALMLGGQVLEYWQATTPGGDGEVDYISIARPSALGDRWDAIFDIHGGAAAAVSISLNEQEAPKRDFAKKSEGEEKKGS